MPPWDKYKSSKPWERVANIPKERPPVDTIPTEPIQAKQDRFGSALKSFIPDITPKNEIGFNPTEPTSMLYKGVESLGQGIANVNKEATGFKTPIVSDVLLNPMTYVGGGVAGEATGGAVGKGIAEYSALGKTIKEAQDVFAKGLPKGAITRKIEETISDVKGYMGELKESFKSIIKEEAQKGATTIKPKIAKFNSDMSEKFGEKLDDIGEVLSKMDTPVEINQQDVASNLIGNALNKASHDPVATSKISALAKKHGFEVGSFPGVDEAGRETTMFNVTAPTENPMTFKDVVKIKNSIRPKVKGHDTAYDAVRDSFTEFISDKLPENLQVQYKDLLADYAPLAEAKWRANSIFKPYDKQGYDIGRGAKFLEDFAQGELDIGKQKLMSMIEKGNELSPGIGKVTDKIKSLGDESIQTEKDLTDFITDLVSTKREVTDALEKRALMRKQAAIITGALGLATGGKPALNKVKGLFGGNF